MAGTDSYVASVEVWAGYSYAPQNWAFCYGQLLPIVQYQALFSLLGSTFGGDNRSTVGVPDMRGRIPVGAGQIHNTNGTTGNTYTLGTVGGVEALQLSIAQLPAHTHAAQFTPTGSPSTLSASLSMPVNSGTSTGSSDPVGKYFGPSGSTGLYYSDKTSGAVMAQAAVTLSDAKSGGTVAVQNSGYGAPVELMQPYIVLHYIICINGLYPEQQ